MDFSLICNEELPPTPLQSRSTTPESSPPSRHKKVPASSLQLPESFFPNPDDRDEAAVISMEKELSNIPTGQYVDRLRVSDSLAFFRLKALRWIISSCARMNYSFTTSFRAANYLDRFASVYCHKEEWESWMTELPAIACLSIAAKFEEIVPASLQSLPMEDLDKWYDAFTIQRMEMIVLNALDWRLCSVTSHSYVDMLTWRLEEILPPSLVATLSTRVTGILLSALPEVEFIGYRPSIVAMAAFQFAIKELCPRKLDCITSRVGHLIPKGRMIEVDECKEKMGSMRIVKETSGLTVPSPNTVLPKLRRRSELSMKSLNLDLLFQEEAENIGSHPEVSRCKKMKR